MAESGWATADRLLLRGCRLPDGSAANVRIMDGQIAAVEPCDVPAPEVISASAGVAAASAGDGAWLTVDVAGRLLTPGLTDPHLHPDKAFGLEQESGPDAPTLAEAIRGVRAQKPAQTADQIYARTLRLAEWCLSLGTTRARVHAEVDPLLGLRSVEGVLAARAALGARMHLQVVAFPQEGIVREPGTLELMREALKIGCDVVGAISYQDPDTRQHLELTAALAREFDTPLDVHADFGVPVERSALATIAEVAEVYGLHGRVLVGHATTLAAMDTARRDKTMARLADAGVAVCALPRTDLFMEGRVAPLEALRLAGVATCVGTNNVLNAFTPVGRPSLPSAAAVYVLTARIGVRPALETLATSLWRAATCIETRAAPPRIAPGAPADLCVWPCTDTWQIVATECDPLVVMVNGSFVHTCQSMRQSLGSTEQSQPRGLRLSWH